MLLSCSHSQNFLLSFIIIDSMSVIALSLRRINIHTLSIHRLAQFFRVSFDSTSRVHAPIQGERLFPKGE